MTRFIVQLLPYSKILRYNLTYNKCIYWRNNGLCLSTFSLKLLVHFKSNFSLVRVLTENTCKKIHLSSTKGCEAYGDIPEEEVGPVMRTIEIEEHSELLRNTLYPNSNDPVINQLKTCCNVVELMDILNKNTSFTSEQSCQTILVLWDLIKGGDKSNSFITKYKMETDDAISDINTIIQRTLHSIFSNMDGLTPEALVCSVLYSNRMGISLKHPHIQTLLSRINRLLINEDISAFPLSALSRLSIVFDENDELWTKLFLIKLLPHIYKNVDRCNTSEDFRALTIAMLSTVQFLTENILVEYEILTDELLRKGTLNKDHPSILVKAVLLLNNIYHKPAARFMIYKLLHMISGNLDNLFLPHFMELHKVVWTNLEPHYMITALEKIKKKHSHFEETKNSNILLYFYFNKLPNNSQTSLILQDAISKAKNLNSLLYILTNLTTTQMEACNLLWAKAADLLVTEKPLDVKKLQQVCLRYMNFTSRMGSYRQKQFESHMLSLITTELVDRAAGLQPKIFAMHAAFVLSYDYHGHNLSDDIIPRLLSMTHQFDTQSCLVLSRGLKQGMLRHNFHRYIDSALNQRTQDILKTMDKSNITLLNMILRSCINQKMPSESELLLDILKRLDHVDWNQLTSRTLRNLVYNLQVTSALKTTAMDKMVEYCLQGCQYITGDTVAKLAYLCFFLGYTPRTNSFLNVTADLIYRDRETLNGLTLLQVALALSFFNHLPPSLNGFIFSVSFMEHLDNEIKHCFAKAKYPRRVRQVLMQLNRSVCLDHPEADVPWFHSKFCEQQQALGYSEGRPKSLLFTDVLSTLTSLVGNHSLVQPWASAPYGYTIDIQINLDAALNPVHFKDSANTVQKLAFLIYHSDSYTSGERRLKGYHQMRHRHLEILGYKVIGISDSLWNAMFMTEPKAKLEYLRKLIWSSTQVGERRHTE